MSEGDPTDDRDDEERHDRETPDDEPADDASSEPNESPEETGANDDGPGGDGDESDGDSDEPEDQADEQPPGHPGPWPGEEPDPPQEANAEDEGESPDDGPAIDEPPTGKEQKRQAVGDDADADESDDVTIAGSGAAPTPDDPEPVGTAGAPDDQEMPLTKHIEEMIRRLLAVIVVMALVSAVVFPFGDRLINFLWYSFLPGQPTECVQQAAAAANATNATNATGINSDAACPRLYHPLSLVLARLKVASLSGFIIALPVFVYETYLFMRPGLYPNERRYYLASVPTSLILAGIGVLFAYLLVLPIIFTYFLGYSQPVAQVAFGLSETFGLILLMLGMFAAIFQIPLFLMLAIMMGVTTRRWLEDRRLYFWFGFAGIAFLFSPDPTGMAPFIVALTMIVLFEGTLLLLRWTGR
jgi:sec-independent protein translocase protein TatC